jgi:hypothetical protein
MTEGLALEAAKTMLHHNDTGKSLQLKDGTYLSRLLGHKISHYHQDEGPIDRGIDDELDEKFQIRLRYNTANPTVTRTSAFVWESSGY